MQPRVSVAILTGLFCLFWFASNAFVGASIGKAAVSAAFMAAIGIPAFLLIIPEDDQDIH